MPVRDAASLPLSGGRTDPGFAAPGTELSEIECRPDLRSLAELRPDLELPLVPVGALAHGQKTEVAGAIHRGLGRLDIHTDAVVADHRADLLRQEGDHHLDVGCLGVLAGVVEGLLNDPEERLLEATPHPDLLADHAQVRVDRVALPELADKLSER